MGIGSFPGVKRPGRGVDHLHPLAPRLRKEYGYTSTPPLGLRGLFKAELDLLMGFIGPVDPWRWQYVASKRRDPILR
jgi:hypothetical protein